jgi:hypothetical protein
VSKLSEPIVSALIQLMQNNLAAELATISAEYQDAIPLPAPPNDMFLFGHRELGPPTAPSMTFELVAADKVVYGNTWSEYKHTVHVVTYVETDTEDALHRMLLRYQRGVWQVIFKNQQLPLNAVGVAISAVPSRMAVSVPWKSGRAFRKACLWEVECYQEVDVP